MNPRSPFQFRPSCLDVTKFLWSVLFLALMLFFPEIVRAQGECIDYHDHPHLVLRESLDWNPVRTVYSHGHLFTADRNGGLTIVEVGLGENPRIRGQLGIQGFANDVAVPPFEISGLSLCYVASGDSCLNVVDCTRKNQPRLLSSINIGFPAFRVFATEALALVIGSYGGLSIVDVSDPYTPLLIGQLNFTGSSREMYAKGPHVYIADHYDGLRIVDISDPYHPYLVSTLSEYPALELTGDGDSLFLMSPLDRGLLKILNISNPVQPVGSGSLFVQNSIAVIEVDGSFVYVMADDGIIRVVDVQDPANAAIVLSLDCTITVLNFAVHEGILFVPLGNGIYSNPGLEIHDIGNGQSVSNLGVIGTTISYAFECLDLVWPLAYTTIEYSIFKIYNVEDPRSPFVVHAEALDLDIADMDVFGNLAVFVGRKYIGDGLEIGPLDQNNFDFGMKIYDVSDPAHPVYMSQLRTGGVPFRVEGRGNFAYVGSNHGLSIVDVSDPARPLVIGAVDLVGDARGVAVGDSYAYVCTDRHDLQVVDISDPYHPFLVAVEDCLGRSENIYLDQNLVYVMNLATGFFIFDVSTPENPVQIGHFNTTGSALDLRVEDGFAYVADNDGGIQVVDVRDPMHPVGVGNVAGQAYMVGLAVRGEYVYSLGKHEFLVYPTQCSYSPVKVDLRPRGMPVTVPEGGGKIVFDLEAENTSAEPVVADLAISVDFPDGSRWELMKKPQVQFDPGETIHRFGMEQAVPGPVPPGTYTYRFTASGWDSQVLDSEEFTFQKEGETSEKVWSEGWHLDGWSDEGSDHMALAAGFAFPGANPNPFNATTTLRFILPDPALTTLKIYDLGGRMVCGLLSAETFSAGPHVVSWSGRDDHGRPSPSGVYFARLEAGDFTATKRMALVR
ncbi:T9SS type A sorting domain-containing protein [bacterium]|nr:T9SS type A sorting domain-containing protein [bacterium]